jgi:hypothetical protein
LCKIEQFNQTKKRKQRILQKMSVSGSINCTFLKISWAWNLQTGTISGPGNAQKAREILYLENPCSSVRDSEGFPYLGITERLIQAHLTMLDGKECYSSYLRKGWHGFPSGNPSENPCHPSLGLEEYYTLPVCIHVLTTTTAETKWSNRWTIDQIVRLHRQERLISLNGLSKNKLIQIV